MVSNSSHSSRRQSCVRLVSGPEIDGLAGKLVKRGWAIALVRGC
jgi:hypothetical protein